MHKHTILCVDDDPNILEAYQRTLRKRFSIETALSGMEGVAKLERSIPYAVIVADMQMPGMNGVEFLEKAYAIAPDTVRIMLTGNLNQTIAIHAINKGHVFQFLTKPCPADTLSTALEAGIKQYELITAERELLEKTLSGSIKVLVDMLSMLEPQSFGLGKKIREYAVRIAPYVGLSNRWELDIASLLLRIGNLTVPGFVLGKQRIGLALSTEEKQMIDKVPEVGASLIANIPRLERVATIVRFQQKCYDGAGYPEAEAGGENIPLEARILFVVADLIAYEQRDIDIPTALQIMTESVGRYDPAVLDAAHSAFAMQGNIFTTSHEEKLVKYKELKLGHILCSDIETKDGILLVAAGNVVSHLVLERLNNFAVVRGIKEPIHVLESLSRSAAA